jgi:alpha-L-fucosidase
MIKGAVVQYETTSTFTRGTPCRLHNTANMWHPVAHHERTEYKSRSRLLESSAKIVR